MTTLLAIWHWIEAGAPAALSTLAVLGVGKLISNFLTGDVAATYIKKELEKLRAEIHANSLVGQLKADDAIINILEATIPEVLHDAGTELQEAVLNGTLGSVDWTEFGKTLWAKVEPQIVGGANDYLKNSSFQDEEALVQMVIGRFFKGQAMAAKGLVK